MEATTEPCRFQEWDSDFFGYNIACVNGHYLDDKRIEAIYAWCEQHAVECLYFLADVGDQTTIRLAEEHDFRLVEVRLTLEAWLNDWRPESRPKAHEGVHVRAARSEDIPVLQRIARNSYEYSRFYFDPCFPEEKCRAFYETWIKNSVEGYADMVLVAEIEEQILGYITGRVIDGGPEGQYVLTAVDERFRKYGVGQELFRSGLDWFVRAGVEHVVVATQGRNIPSQRLIQRHGFLSRATQLYYHRWFLNCSMHG